MPGARPSSPRSSGPRGGRTPRPGSRPGARPAPRPAAVRPRAAAGRRAPARPRFTGRAAVLVLVLAVLMVSYASSMRAYLQQRDQINALRNNINTSRTQIAELEREKKRFKDPAYVRALARQRLGFALPGEVELQVVGPDGKPLGHADSLSDPAVGQGAKQPQWWQSAWGSVVAAGTPKAKRHTPTPATKIQLPKSKRH